MIPIVTIAELATYILEQDNDKPVYNGSGSINAPRGGCIMTQYGIERGFKFKRSFCAGGWVDERGNYVARLEVPDEGYGDIFNRLFRFGANFTSENHNQTFGDLKSALKPEFIPH